ncbi:cytochrome c oxidase subunit 6C [Orussus abietinus]|uniref:cytochrome c oxidase subunit 6C n=1 Tax=Orussus abietinus TaxID=222816 RepID=UPI000626E0B5|nr:cytochrome c oxidase subunit 6C [Orussus abietinus]XP_012272634.1 cytochrome c oxidase subunit 6C [Orussus abietinus]
MTEGKIPKPQLRGLLASSMKKHCVGMILFTTFNAALFKFCYMDPKKKKFEDFYKTYDADKQFQIMVDAGLISSVPAGEKV